MKPCMTTEDAAEWRQHNERLVARNMRALSPCEDCTVRFAVEMRLAGRCDGWPEDRPDGRPWSRSADERQEMARRRWRESKQRTRSRATA